jgi:ribosomal protein L14
MMTIPVGVKAQSESHNFITYDTMYVYHYDAWHSFNYYLRISRPANLFTAGNPDTAMRPAIITMPGVGEMGHDTTKLYTYGPHYWLLNGWDGSVVLGNGTHYPILVTMICDVSPPQPPVPGNLEIVNYLIAHYHINPKAVHLGGLSEGAFTWSSMLSYEATPGDEAGMKPITSVTLLSGAATSTGNWTIFGHWAKKYHGRAFLTVGYADAQTPNPPQLEQAMNDSVKGSAYFTYNTLGGGSHCCWNSDYDPNQHNWQSFAPLGTYITTSTDTNSRGTYVTGWSIFQWMLRQGDTTLVGSGAPPPTPGAPSASAGSAQTVTLPTNTLTLTGSGSETNGTIASYAWTQTAGPSGATMAAAGQATTGVSGLTQGSYTFQLTVTDNSGVTATSTVQVTVNAASVPPSGPTGVGPLPIKKVVPMEYWTGYWGANDTLYAYSNNSANPVALPLPGGQTVTAAYGGFNKLWAVSNTGQFYGSSNYNNGGAISWTLVPTDTSGATLNNVINVWSYQNSYVIERADSSLWSGGIDYYQLYHSTGTINMAPTRMSPAGLKFAKVAMGAQHCAALTTDGKVYRWDFNQGNTTPTLMSTPRPVVDIAASDFNSVMAIVAQASGDQTVGNIYAWGDAWGTWGATSAASYTTLTDVSSVWTAGPWKKISMDANTMHAINSSGALYGAGYNPQGEVGNGVEFINRYTYPNWRHYGWDFGNYEDGTAPTAIAPGIVFTDIYDNPFFTFYKFAKDASGNIYSWGRGKTLVLGNGLFSGDTFNASDPNLWDVTKPTKVTPLSSPITIFAPTLPVSGAGPSQSVTTSSATVAVTGHPVFQVNGTDTICCSYAAFQWTQVSGPGGATIVSPTSKSTVINGLVNGTYKFQVLTTDSHNGLDTASVQIVCNMSGSTPTVSAGSNQTITLPTNTVTLVGTASESGGTIATYAWTQISGPSTANFGSAGLATTTANGLVQGVYRFQLMVTDLLGVTATATVQVTVNAAVVAGPPVANAGSDQTITLPANSVTLTGSGSETNGTIVSYAWTQVSGPSTASFGTAGVATTTAGGLLQGVYRFQLTVKDNSGVTANATVQVTVNAAPVVPGPPSANAGSAQTITLPTNSASLAGSGSETNGTIVSYAWTQVTGPSTATIGTAGSASTTVSALVQGIYRFQLTVTDNSGVTASATVQVTVNAAPVVPGPPSANAGSSVTITLPTSSTSLAGSGSETNGTIVSYAWTQVSGPSTATIGSAGSAATTVSGLVQGAYTFKLTVTDNSGVTASDVVLVTVNPAAAVPGTPVANAGVAQTITLPTSSVTLAGSGSESGGTIASYAWAQLSGPSTATIGSAGSASTLASALVEGVYRFELTVTDNSGVTASATVQITVNAAPVVPGPPSANAGSDVTITLPTSSTSLAGSGSETNGTIVSYAWTQLSGPSTAAIGSAGSAATTVGGLVQGTYEFKLTVTDNSGVTASDVMYVTVNAAPVVPGPPSANAGSDVTITLPTSSTSLAGSGSETNGTIVSYAWTQVSGPSTAVIGSAGSAATTVSGLVQGAYTFKLTVTDNSGVTATDVITVTVKAATAVPGPPSANAGSDQTITLPTSSTSLAGSGSETNGTIVSYAWTQASGPSTAVIGSAGSAATTVSGLVKGVYRFELTVTDNSGVQATDIVTVTVNPLPLGQLTANAGTNQTITLPTNNVTLTGSGSETNGTVVSYAWKQLGGPTTATINASSSAQTAVNGMAAAGLYTFQLTVSDATGATATATVSVTVKSHVPPVANAGPNTTTSVLNGYTLNGTGSYDVDGTIVSYSWVQISGAGGVTIVNENTAMPTLDGLQIGVYVFQLTVTDDAGASATATVTITVSANGSTSDTSSNQPPVAIAGADTTIYYPNGDTAVLNGSASYAPGSTINTYSWSEVSGPSEMSVTNSSSAVGWIAGMAPGNYVFRLTVSNMAGDTASSLVTVHVLDNQRTSDVINLYPNPVQVGQQMTVTGSNGYAGQVKFTIIDMRGSLIRSVVMDKQAPTFIQTISVSGLSRGTYVLLIEFSQNQKPTALKFVVQ